MNIVACAYNLAVTICVWIYHYQKKYTAADIAVCFEQLSLVVSSFVLVWAIYKMNKIVKN